MVQEKNLAVKECDSVKKQLSQARDCIDKIVTEKTNLINNNQTIQAELDKLKTIQKNMVNNDGSDQGGVRSTSISSKQSSKVNP